MLAASGYATYAVGKWHLSPEDETHMGAPRRSWPLGRGFQRWYGFILRAVGGYGLPDALRMTIGSEEANRLVVAALADFLAGKA